MKHIIDKQFDFCYGHRVHNQRLDTRFTESGDACLKCFPGYTKVKVIKDNKLNNISINELYKNKNQFKKILSFNEQNNLFEEKNIKDVWITKETDELIKIELADGSFFECTADHKILLKNDQWKEAQFLKEGDEIVALQ